MRFFNNAGPVVCREHFCLDPLHRIDLAEIERLIEQKRYFILYVPCQTGKTSTLLAYFNRQGRYRCLYVNGVREPSWRCTPFMPRGGVHRHDR